MKRRTRIALYGAWFVAFTLASGWALFTYHEGPARLLIIPALVVLAMFLDHRRKPHS